MVEQNGNSNAHNVGKHVNSLLQQSGITIVGFSHATSISLNHARVIKNGKSSITIKTAEKIARFFSIEAGLLFLANPIVLKDPLSIPQIISFYKENSSNEKFFTSSAKQNNLTSLLRSLIKDEQVFEEWVRSKDLVDLFDNNEKYSKYKLLFNIKSISKALGRIYCDTELLEREDFRKNGKVFQYRRKR